MSGVTVTFARSGSNSGVGSAITNSSGNAVHTWTGSTGGEDAVTATVLGTTAAGTGTVTWRTPAALTLTAAPTIATVGNQATATAHVLDQDGNALGGVTVNFNRLGANSGSGSAVTDSSGDAVHTWTGTSAGVDTVRATAGTVAAGATTVAWQASPTTTTSSTTTTTPPTTIPPPPDLFTGYTSSDCDTDPDATVVNFQSGTAYAKLRVKNVGSETWICMAMDGGTGTAHVGGKVILDATEIPIDDEQAACHESGEPPFPQHVEGTFGPGNTPVHLDVITVPDGPGVPSAQLWICAQIDTVAKRIIIPGTAVRFVPDSLEHTDPPTTTTSSTTTTTIPKPPAGQPSRYCVNNGGSEVLNEPAAGGRVWVYTLQSGSVAHVCVRYQTGPPDGDPGMFAGGHLRVDGVGQEAIVAENRTDFTTDPAYAPDGPCDVNVVNITSDPELIIKFRNPTHGSPAFLCVRADETARRIKIDADQTDTLIDFDQDTA